MTTIIASASIKISLQANPLNHLLHLFPQIYHPHFPNLRKTFWRCPRDWNPLYRNVPKKHILIYIPPLSRTYRNSHDFKGHLGMHMPDLVFRKLKWQRVLCFYLDALSKLTKREKWYWINRILLIKNYAQIITFLYDTLIESSVAEDFYTFKIS